MKAVRPWIVAVVLFLLALSNLVRGPSGTGAQAAGYLFATIFVPALLAVLYARWYRRRFPPTT